MAVHRSRGAHGVEVLSRGERFVDRGRDVDRQRGADAREPRRAIHLVNETAGFLDRAFVTVAVGADTQRRHGQQSRFGQRCRRGCDALIVDRDIEIAFVGEAQRYGLFIPRVGIVYSSGEFGGAPGSGIANTAHRDDLALQLYWQFDAFGLGHRAKLNAREAELREIGLQRDKLHDAIVTEIKTAYAGVQSRHSQLPLADVAVRHAAQAYELQRDRIYDQQGLPLEAQQAMQALATAELARIEVAVGYDLAQVRLHTALGNPLERTTR